MAQGTAKKLVGQQASTDSAPVVLSNEQEIILSDIAGSSSNTDNQLLTALQAQGTAISSIYPIVIAAEDSTSGNSDILKSDAGSLLVRFASNPTVIVSDAGGSLSIDDNGGTLSVDDGGGSITVDGSVTLGAGTAYAGKVRLTDGTTDAEVIPLAGYNGQAVAIVDGSGNQITSFGGGTQYTEDDAAAANPVGTAPILIRQDTPAAVTSADGDNVAQRGSNYGAAYTHVLDADGNITNIDSKLNQILNQLRDRPELNYLGNLKVELQSTGTSPITITSGIVTSVTVLTNVGSVQTDISYLPFVLHNQGYYLATSQFLYN